MREIKFRAWDKSQKKMVEVDHLTWGRGDDIVQGTLSEINEEMPEWFGLMQYTGLKDKNEVPIYEGDIIQHTGFAGHIKSVIEWNDSRMGWTDFHPRAEFIVVGNIYESPELLEENE